MVERQVSSNGNDQAASSRYRIETGTGNQLSFVKEDRHGTVSIGYDRTHELSKPSFGAAVKLVRGEPPSNSELDDMIQRTHSALETQQVILDDRGRAIVADTKRLLENLQDMLHRKNADEKLQRLLRSTHHGAKETAQATRQEAAKLVEQPIASVRREAYELVDDMKLVVRAMITSGEFRSIILQLLGMLDASVAKARAKPSSSSAADSQQLTANRELLEERIRQLLSRLATNDEYRATVRRVVNITDALRQRFTSLKANPDISDNANFKRSIGDMKSLIAEFTSADEVELFTQRCQTLFNDLTDSEEARSFFTDVRSYIQKSINNPVYVDSEEGKSAIRSLMQRGRMLLRTEKYRQDMDALQQSLRRLMEAFQQDAEYKAVRDSINSIFRDAVFDDTGKPDIFAMQDASQQVRLLIAPLIKSALEDLPLPSISGSDNTYEYSFSELTLDGRDVLPDTFTVRVQSESTIKTATLGPSTSNTLIEIAFDNVRPRLKNLKFSYTRKALPKIQDQGHADVEIAGTGLGLRVGLRISKLAGRPLRIDLDSVNANIDKLNIQIHQARHRSLDLLTIKLFNRVIKKSLCRRIEKRIFERLVPALDRLDRTIEQRYIISQGEHRKSDLPQMANNTLKHVYDTLQQQQQEQPQQQARGLTGRIYSSISSRFSKIRASAAAATVAVAAPTQVSEEQQAPPQVSSLVDTSSAAVEVGPRTVATVAADSGIITPAELVAAQQQQQDEVAPLKTYPPFKGYSKAQVHTVQQETTAKAEEQTTPLTKDAFATSDSIVTPAELVALSQKKIQSRA